MQRIAKGMFACCIIVAMVGMATQCYAQDPAKKLYRGLANVLTGWVELPKNIYDTSVEENMLSGLTMGLAKGIGMTIVRTGAGVYETVTFALPVPEDYVPVLEPEFIFKK